MITIGKPYVEHSGERAALHAPVTISEDTAKLYVEETAKIKVCKFLTEVDYPPAAWKEKESGLSFYVEEKYSDSLCTERSNAFVIAFLWYALITGSDIRFTAPVSKRLYDGLTDRLIPLIAEENHIRPIRLLGPTTEQPLDNAGGIVTGISCGVDSLYALHCYGKENTPPERRITHLIHCVADSLFPFIDPPYQVEEIIQKYEYVYNKHEIHNAGVVAKKYGVPLIVVRTNLDLDFYRGGLPYTGMYRFLCCTLSLEKLFSSYYVASSGNAGHVTGFSLVGPTQDYEEILCDCCSTESFHYHLSDKETRVNKLRAIADDPTAHRILSVCFGDGEDGINCGACFGCWKTMIPLDIMGKLSAFSPVFDLPKYYGNRKKVMKDLIEFSKIPASSTAREVVRQTLELTTEYPGEAASDFRDVINDTGHSDAS